jgi:2-hydroxychromene-2-carboxylate isomerase
MSRARMNPVRFYFDFTSTFSYIAIQKIDDLVARYGATADWRAVSLSHLFRAQGVAAPPTVPKKFAYLEIDFPRSCAFAGLPCKIPSPFPPDVKLARVVFWYLKARDEQTSHAYARAISRAVFGEGRSVATAVEIAAAYPAPSAAEVTAAGADAAAKAAVLASLADAQADGMIGAPFMVVDGEPFWGADRLDHVAARLAQRA